MELYLIQNQQVKNNNMQKMLVPTCPVVPLTGSSMISSISTNERMGQVEKADLSRLSHSLEAAHYGTSRTNGKNELVPQLQSEISMLDKAFRPMGQGDNTGQAKNDVVLFSQEKISSCHQQEDKLYGKYKTLIPRLGYFIERAGQHYQAQAWEVDEMKEDILNFINTKTDGLNRALMCFENLILEIESKN